LKGKLTSAASHRLMKAAIWCMPGSCAHSPFGGSNPPAPARQCGAARICPKQCRKCPPMAGFCDSGNGLQAPDFANCGPESPKVSSPTPKYSRFWETAARDRVRSTLPDRVCSATRQILRSALRSQIPELNPVEKHLAVYARQLAVEPRLQILRR
jgi:hypothetical protein